MNPFENLPQDLVNFLLVALFALLIGLEQRRYHDQEKTRYRFGTDRTFALVGVLGFVTYVLDKEGMVWFACGGILLTVFLAIAYAGRIWKESEFGMTTVLIALITYCLTPLVYTQPYWLVLLILITVLILVEIKDSLIAVSAKFDKDEFVTLAKFIAIVGVILPITPKEPIFPGIAVTPYQFWLAVVAVSVISYVSYLLKKFVFPSAGMFLTGVLGGLYSSTATAVSLTGKTRTAGYPPFLAASAVLISTAVMYLRTLTLAFLFNAPLGQKLLVPLLVLSGVAGLASLYFHYQNKTKEHVKEQAEAPQRNPLEFSTALLFALLFVIFAVLTHFALQYYGRSGLNILSFIVGVTDIDPFLINLFQGKQAFPEQLVVVATIQATISNNLLKTALGATIGTPAMRRNMLLGFGVVIAASFLVLLLI